MKVEILANLAVLKHMSFRCPPTRGKPLALELVLLLSHHISCEQRHCSTWDPSSQLKCLTAAVLPGSLVSLRHLPPACDARAYAQKFVAVLPEFVSLFQRDRAQPYDGGPFCQDEKTSLPAEMLRLDS